MRRATVLALIALSACGEGAGPPPPPRAAVPNARNGLFDVAVVVDPGLRRRPSHEEIEQTFEQAQEILDRLTHERMRLTEVVYATSPASTLDTARLHLLARASDPPEAVIVLSEDADARALGGYSIVTKPPFPFVNEFPSPKKGVGSDKVYVAVVHFDHIYARCGYDENGSHVSAVSRDEECLATPGIPCVPRGNSWICANAAGKLYAQPGVFTASTFVHELLHPFALGLGHYGMPECAERTGLGQGAESDEGHAQWNVVLCPDTFARFRRAR